MLFRRRFYHSLIAGLACAALLSGCAAGQGRRASRTRVQIWPEAWPQPFWNRSVAEPTYQPIPADPSGSPYPPSSPRGLYVPSGPAPESRLGLPVPPPLPPGSDDAGPVPEEREALPAPIPPAADDMDMSLDLRSTRRPSVVPPPPPEAFPLDVPRVAERIDEFDRNRQPVDLQGPEPDFDADFRLDAAPTSSRLGRSPVEAFPQPRQMKEGLDRGPAHTPAIEDDDEELPTGVDPSGHRPLTDLPGPLPRLRDPDESDLAFPGVNKQMSGERRTRSARVEAAVARLRVRSFRLTRDARVGSEAVVIGAQDLHRGQHVVVQTELDGLESIGRNSDSITRVISHIEIRDAQNQVHYRGDKQNSAEVSPAPRNSRELTLWMTIPARLKPGSYSLQLYLQDEIAHQTTVAEMPIAIQ